MDEDDALALLVAVLLDGLAEHVELMVQYVGAVHARGGVEQFAGMEVDHHGGILVDGPDDGLAHHAGVVGRFLLHHLLLQLLGVDVDAHGHAVVLDDGMHQRGLLEEVVLLKGVELVELHGIDAQLQADGLLQQEGLVFLVGHELHGHALHLVERLAPEFLDEELGVGLYLARRLQAPGVALGGHVGIADVVVAVVDEIGLETGVGDGLQVDGHEGKIDAEHVAPAALLDGWTEGDGAVGRLHFGLLYGSLLLGVQLRGHHLGYVIVVGIDDNHLAAGRRYLEAVFVFHQDQVFSLEAGDDAAAGLGKESHFISYFHILFDNFTISRFHDFTISRFHDLSFIIYHLSFSEAHLFLAGYQQTAVAIAEEAETVGEGVVVDAAPVASHEGADQEQQR